MFDGHVHFSEALRKHQNRDSVTFPLHTSRAEIPDQATSLDMGAQRSARADMKSISKEMEKESLSFSVSEAEEFLFVFIYN